MDIPDQHVPICGNVKRLPELTGRRIHVDSSPQTEALQGCLSWGGGRYSLDNLQEYGLEYLHHV